MVIIVEKRRIMEKRNYIHPKIKMLDICGRRNLLQGMHVGGTVTGSDDIGFSKRNDLEMEAAPQNFHYNVWEDE